MRQEVLLVIDMQRKFIDTLLDERKSRLLQGVTRLAGYIRQRNLPVLFVQLKNEGDTIPLVRELFPTAHIVTKPWNDGSSQVAAFFGKRLAQGEFDFLLCGVNRCACVIETAQGLLKLKETTVTKRITASLVLDATTCNCELECSMRHDPRTPPDGRFQITMVADHSPFEKDIA